MKNKNKQVYQFVDSTPPSADPCIAGYVKEMWLQGHSIAEINDFNRRATLANQVDALRMID